MQQDFDTARSLGNIEGKLDTLLSTFSAHVKQTHEDFGEVRGRVTRLEKWQTKVIAYGTVAGAGAALLVKVFLR